MKGIIYRFIIIAVTMALASCEYSSHELTDADRYNDLSYAFHYRNLDSTMYYARKAASATSDYNRGYAEALNNMAFVYIQRMDYDSARICLKDISDNTDNQMELAVADIQNMRLCQRCSQNKDFYDYREKARKRLDRIEEEESTLDERELRRLIYAHTETAIINSVYYYYVGMEKRSEKALSRLDDYKYLRNDTAQFINYLYQKGSQSTISEVRSYEEIHNLMQCYLLSNYGGYTYWKANALQMLAECFASEKFRERANVKAISAYLNIYDMPDDLLSGYLANMALDMFINYGDTYQIAGTYRTLALCYLSIRDFDSALFCLDKALSRDTAVNQAPDLVAGIREMMSVTYSETNDKQQSDYNRNIYLDIQEKTRQDRRFEARAEKLDKSLDELNIMIISVVAMIVILIALLFVFNMLRRRKYTYLSKDKLFEPIRKWQKETDRILEDRKSEYEEASERSAIEKLKIIQNKRRAADNRAKISLAETVLPLINRMLNETERIKNDNNAQDNERRLEYVSQLADKIDEYNSVLTQWIELRKGLIGINIESFNLQEIFDTVSKGSMAYRLKGINFNVVPTDAVVKADRVLTLFMINTIADNARKHTSDGGSVKISAEKHDEYVDISVTDSGCGIKEEQLNTIFTRDISGGHGFGLSNCRGIIEKYRKTSRLFSVCDIWAESKIGEGSRFTFRLPSGILKMLAVVIMSAGSLISRAAAITPDTLAAHYADSVYYSNVEGVYDEAVQYADSVIKYMNICYRRAVPGSSDTMMLRSELRYNAPEIRWFNNNVDVNYTVILDVRNELAVAALALHNHDLYKYNNKAYTSLFKKLSQDKDLPEYCRTMQKSKNDKTIAVILLVILLISVFPAYYFLYYRHIISRKLCLEKVSYITEILHSDTDVEDKLSRINDVVRENSYELSTKVAAEVAEALQHFIDVTRRQLSKKENAEDDFLRAEYENDRMYISNSITDNCLSTLKHETMYYPARIKQMAYKSADDITALQQLVEYYHDLYSILMMQAMQQTNSMVFENKKFNIDELLCTDSGLVTRGDRDVMEYMFEIIKKYSADGLFCAHPSDDGRYIIVETELKNNPDRNNMFVAENADIPYLLCRSIVRDHSEVTGMRGCGIDVCTDSGGKDIIKIKLARA